MKQSPVVDCLQYANWSEKVFRQMCSGGVHAVHATVAYHGSFREMVHAVEKWNLLFRRHSDLIFPGRSGDDIRRAVRENRTAIFFGLQNPSPIGDDLGLVEIVHALGIRFMQLSYNMQSLLAGGCLEPHDGGLTQFGRNVVADMNRIGIAVDLSHAGERSLLEAVDASEQPVAVTHANPDWWHSCPRNLSDGALGALAGANGMLGLSLYPHHLRNGSDCTLQEFCEMAAECASRYGCAFLGVGSDLCQDQDDSVVAWMRSGRWAERAAADAAARFPEQPLWFRDNRDFPGIAAGLERVGFSTKEVAGIMGGNWLRHFDAVWT